MKMPSLLTRIAIALASASVTSAVLVFVVSLSEPASTPADGKMAAPASQPAPKTPTTRRMSRAVAPELTDLTDRIA